jgi:hypothetical protein
MDYRIDKQSLLDKISTWDSFLKRKTHLIACGGTALTLLGVKASTKDIDFIVPVIAEWENLINILKKLGYKSASGWGWSRGDGFIFELFRGKVVHTTELLESPLDRDNHVLLKEFSNVYLGVLNYYDLIISKLFRATEIDIDDCLSLIKSKRKEIDLKRLKERFRATASYDVSENKVNKKLEYFFGILRKNGIKQ